MIQAHGMVLEGGVAVGHGRVAGVAGFGEEAEIREAETLHQVGARPALVLRHCLPALRMEEHAQE
jgi:hypothetical protein